MMQKVRTNSMRVLEKVGASVTNMGRQSRMEKS
jgi:hypothetical protein